MTFANLHGLQFILRYEGALTLRDRRDDLLSGFQELLVVAKSTTCPYGCGIVRITEKVFSA